MSPEQALNAREARRVTEEDRYLARFEKREAAAETMIGMLIREGKEVYYVSPPERARKKSSDPGMRQSRLASLVESLMNVAIGFAVALLSQIVLFPLVGISDVPLTTNLELGAYFTAISLARSYAIRRWFNGRLRAAAQTAVRVASGA